MNNLLIFMLIINVIVWLIVFIHKKSLDKNKKILENLRGELRDRKKNS